MHATSFYFGPTSSKTRETFGWFHPAEESSFRGVGVVLCNPIGDDDIRAHRTLRHLAERLSKLGFAVLRFDFRGTGDSMGSEGDPDRVNCWFEDIESAILELRARSGIEKVTLIGLRLGATLAALSAERLGDIDSLVLWGGCTDGKEFVSKITQQHRMHAMLSPESFALERDNKFVKAAEGREALGFFLSDAVSDEICRLSLLNMQSCTVGRALVIGEKRPSSPIHLKFRLLGVEADYLPGAPMGFMTTPPHVTQLPVEQIAQIVEWIDARYSDKRGPISKAVKSPAARDLYDVTPRSEHPVFIGKETPLFGILNTGSSNTLPAIIMLNAGTVHRVGPHRSYVRMARAWADLGFSVLRLDLSGVGDSKAESGTDENLCYPKRTIADIQDAMDFLENRLKAKRFIVAGLCSGADNAFHAGLLDPRIVGTVMMNPLTFRILDQHVVEGGYRKQQWQSAIFNRQKWSRLIRGKMELAPFFRGIIDDIVGKLRRAFKAKKTKAERSPVTRGVPDSLEWMANKGVKTLLVATVGDPGVKFADTNFSEKMKALELVSGFRRINFSGTDHTFTSLTAQNLVLQSITDHLIRNHA